MIIALHGDGGNAEMLEDDVGDLRGIVDCFYNAHGWFRFNHYSEKLLRFIDQLVEPPILIGYSRGGSVIAWLSETVEIAAAVVYESPVLDSEGVGGSFPVLQIWNDRGARYGRNELRRGQAIIAEQIWGQNHQVTQLIGTGRHMRTNPLGHAWDASLNQQIREWLALHGNLLNTATD